MAGRKDLTNRELDEEIEFAALTARRVMVHLMSARETIFPQSKEPWYHPNDEDVPKKNAAMCGRYGRRADKQRIAEWMQNHDTNVFDESYLAPSYNVAPQSFRPVVRLNKDGVRELALMR